MLSQEGCHTTTLQALKLCHAKAQIILTTRAIRTRLLSYTRSNKDKKKIGGRDRVRTCDPLLAKQVLSQLSYTPTFGATLILKHFRALRNPFLRFSVITVPKLYPNHR